MPKYLPQKPVALEKPRPDLALKINSYVLQFKTLGTETVVVEMKLVVLETVCYVPEKSIILTGFFFIFHHIKIPQEKMKPDFFS